MFALGIGLLIHFENKYAVVAPHGLKDINDMLNDSTAEPCNTQDGQKLFEGSLPIFLEAISDQYFVSISFPLLHHSLQLPTYSLGISKPADSNAKMVWQAVTPEPQ